MRVCLVLWSFRLTLRNVIIILSNHENGSIGLKCHETRSKLTRSGVIRRDLIRLYRVSWHFKSMDPFCTSKLDRNLQKSKSISFGNCCVLSDQPLRSHKGFDRFWNGLTRAYHLEITRHYQTKSVPDRRCNKNICQERKILIFEEFWNIYSRNLEASQ